MTTTNRRDSSGIEHLREDTVLESVEDALHNLGEGTSGYRWDDLRMPSTLINPPGLASDPGRDTTDGTLLFAATGQELIFTEAQMPHAWVNGTDIKPHVHWAKTTSAAGDVAWQLEYKHAPINAVMDASFTLIGPITTAVFTDPDTLDHHLITSFGSVTMTGYNDSHIMLFKLSRMGSDVGDTYGADAKLLSYDVHYQSNSRGSVTEFGDT